MPVHLKQTFLSIIWIFTEGKGDGIEPDNLLKYFLLYKGKKEKVKYDIATKYFITFFNKSLNISVPSMTYILACHQTTAL